MKKFIYIFILVVIGMAIFGVRVSGLSYADGKLSVNKDAWSFMKVLVKKANAYVYDKASQNNPQGDAMPDQVDDVIKDTLKREIRQRINQD